MCGKTKNSLSHFFDKNFVKVTFFTKAQCGNFINFPPFHFSDSAMRQSDGTVIASKQKIKASSSPTSYEVNLMASKPAKGFYELTVTAIPNKANNKLIGNEGAKLVVKVLGSASIENVEIGVADSDQSTAAKLTQIVHPKMLPEVLPADHHHKLILKFIVKDKNSGEKIKVHQAFVKLALKNSEIIYVAEPDNAGNYKFDLDVSAKAKEFGSKSGKYSVSLIVGDAVVSNPVNWNLADISLQFPGKKLTFWKSFLTAAIQCKMIGLFGSFCCELVIFKTS